MKISFNWLKKFCAVDLPAEEVAELLTFCGLETEYITAYESVPGMLKGLVTGEVLEKEKHPNADKLSICKVNTGSAVQQIVCGASNVAAGQKVIVALPGTKLFPVNGESFEIKKSKIRGEVSEGMICAEDEIGLGNSHDGIIVLDQKVVPGTPVSDYFKEQLINDTVFEIGLTPNRGDAASHFGVARDLAAVINNRRPKVNHPSVKISFPDYKKGMQGRFICPVKVTIENTASCLRYSGLLIDGIKVQESPAWLKHSLMSIGLKPINNVVDITNFVLHELGQPLHAFDAGKISGNHIIVKNLPAGTSFITLDNAERKLNGNELMICDDSGGLCIAGVFGGINSGITENTTQVFLESACFLPASIRNTSKHHGLKTDASFRFERGTDFEMTLPALFRAAQLIQEVCGGKISNHTDVVPSSFNPHKISFTPEKAYRLMGFKIEESIVQAILHEFGFAIDKTTESNWQITVPSYKTEVRNLADVTEEILRIYGYGNIPLPSQMHLPMPEGSSDKAEVFREKMASFLVSNGFTEIFNNSLVPADEATDNVKLLNPLSIEHAAMRSDMVTSGLVSIAYNLNHKNRYLRLFESGRVYFSSENGFTEQNCLSLFLAGNRNQESWIETKPEKNNFYTLKSILIQMLNAAGIKTNELAVKQFRHPQFEFAAQCMIKGKAIATLGYVNNTLLNRFEVDSEVLCAVVNLDVSLSFSADKRNITEPSLYPVVKRDLALLINQTVAYSDLEHLAFSALPGMLYHMEVFDIYKGEKIPEGKMSMAISFYLQDTDKTLTDKQIDNAMNKLISAFISGANAEIRK